MTRTLLGASLRSFRPRPSREGPAQGMWAGPWGRRLGAVPVGGGSREGRDLRRHPRIGCRVWAGPSAGLGWTEQGVSCRLWVNWTLVAKPPEAGGGRPACSRSRI